MDENRKLLYSSRFLQALIDNRDVQEIIDIGFELLGNPILVIDNNYKVVAYTHNISVEDPNWYRAEKNDYIAVDVIMSNDKFTQARKSGHPIRYKEKNLNFEAIYATILIDNKLAVYLVAPDHLKKFGDDDLEIVELIKNVLTLHFQKSKLRTMNQMNKSLFIDLLDGRVTDQETIETRYRRLNWVLHGNYYIMTIENSDGSDERTLEQTGEFLQKIIADSKYAIYRDVVVVLITRKKRDFPNSCLEALMEFLKTHNLRAGISNCFNSLMNTSEQFNLSLLAVELGTKSAPDKLLYLYEDYLFYHILSLSADQINLYSICPAALHSLIKHDSDPKEDLVNCLFEYLKNGKNLQKTANVLGIHRNTLTYRIKKIVDILEVDIENEDVAFNLLLATKIVRYIELFKKEFKKGASGALQSPYTRL